MGVGVSYERGTPVGGMRVPRLLLGGMEEEESQVEGEDGGTTERTERLDASNHQVHLKPET